MAPAKSSALPPLAGDLFSPAAIGILAQCKLGNDVLLGCLRSLGLYQHPDNGQTIRVNYAALNVEEFGSVYEGLLEFQPVFLTTGERVEFDFAQGDQRAATGSHYTPDDLVQPLIKHSLDYLIADALKKPDPAKALLDLRVADISCGSGHILLAAARRIATELAVVRTGEEQPSPSAFRAAIRDVIRECIYGVDLNPLAVELCKVALWLEAHTPGEPLNFLDHHIKCGNAIVGFARREEAERGVPDEAFKTLPDDDKDTAALLRKRNKKEREDRRLWPVTAFGQPAKAARRHPARLERTEPPARTHAGRDRGQEGALPGLHAEQGFLAAAPDRLDPDRPVLHAESGRQLAKICHRCHLSAVLEGGNEPAGAGDGGSLGDGRAQALLPLVSGVSGDHGAGWV